MKDELKKEREVPITEQASFYDDLEQMSTAEILHAMNAEDKKVAEAVEKCLPVIGNVVDVVSRQMACGGRLFYVGAGTSGRLGVLDASEIPPTFGVAEGRIIGLIAGGEQALRHAVENAEDDEMQGWQDLEAFRPTVNDFVIGIAASGSTPYVVGCLHEARKRNIGTACLTSVPQSPITHEADYAIEMFVGQEFLTGSSRLKSGTGQKMILNQISTAIMIRLGRVKGNKMIHMQLTNKKLWKRSIRMLCQELKVTEANAAQLLQQYGSVGEVLKETMERTTEYENTPSS
ncbi:MAG: N-acetylmuramic acid 6-phosphate etherase [Bacteroidaceae bacterium]